jgi:hypothetical protein
MVGSRAHGVAQELADIWKVAGKLIVLEEVYPNSCCFAYSINNGNLTVKSFNDPLPEPSLWKESYQNPNNVADDDDEDEDSEEDEDDSDDSEDEDDEQEPDDDVVMTTFADCRGSLFDRAAIYPDTATSSVPTTRAQSPAPPMFYPSPVPRGDESGDITNCLNTGYIIMHTTDLDTWAAVYNETTNSLSTIESYYGITMQPSEITRGSEPCPIQDFVASHLKSLGKPYNDNSWTECMVMGQNSDMTHASSYINIRDLVRQHFSRA